MFEQDFTLVPVCFVKEPRLESSRDLGYCHSCGRWVWELSVCCSCGFTNCLGCLKIRNGIPVCIVCLERSNEAQIID